jgi:hypothetical protein
VKLCGASISRCSVCGTAVAPSRIRRQQGCPRHPDAEVVAATCTKAIKPEMECCKIHGAGAPQLKAAAAERLVESKARSLLEVRGVTPVGNPLQALAQLIGEATAMKDYFLDRVNDLQTLTVTDQLGREDVRALLGAYERAMDRCGRLLVDASKLHIEAHLFGMEVRSDEQQVQQLLDAVLPVLALVPKPLAVVLRKAVADRLRAVAHGESMPRLPDLPVYVPAPPAGPVPAALEPAPSPPDDEPSCVEEPASSEREMDVVSDDDVEIVEEVPATASVERFVFVQDPTSYVPERLYPGQRDPSQSYAANLRQEW